MSEPAEPQGASGFRRRPAATGHGLHLSLLKTRECHEFIATHRFEQQGPLPVNQEGGRMLEVQRFFFRVLHLGQPGKSLLSVLLAVAFPAAQAQEPAQGELVAGASATTRDVARTPVRLDREHPLVVLAGSAHDQAARAHEKGSCHVRAQVGPDGVVRAVQLVSSTGSIHLDEICWRTIIAARFIPATADGKPVSTWTDVPLYLGHGVPIGRKPDYSMIPHFDRDYRLNVGQETYPAKSLERHQEGICAVHVLVARDGTPGDVSLSKSTGIPDLDKACVAAIQSAQFMPGIQDGSAVTASTDIFINWRIVSP